MQRSSYFSRASGHVALVSCVTFLQNPLSHAITKFHEPRNVCSFISQVSLPGQSCYLISLIFHVFKMHTVGLPADPWFVPAYFSLGLRFLFTFVDPPIFGFRFFIALSKAVDAKLTMSPVVRGTKKILMTTSARIHLPLRASRPPIPTRRISGYQV